MWVHILDGLQNLESKNDHFQGIDVGIKWREDYKGTCYLIGEMERGGGYNVAERRDKYSKRREERKIAVRMSEKSHKKSHYKVAKKDYNS